VKVLITAAHPDDTEFVCGGTVATLARSGAEITLVVVTSGEAGLPAGADATVREREQTAAAAVIGMSSTHFLRFPDGLVEPSLDLRRELTAAVRRVRPDLVITHTPHRNLRSVRSSHPDHLAVGQATLATVYPDARNERMFPALLEQGLEPHSVPEVWLHGTAESDLGVDITAAFSTKMDAIRCHRSQLAGLGGDPEGFFRTWAEESAAQQRMPPGSLAEEFFRIDSR